MAKEKTERLLLSQEHNNLQDLLFYSTVLLLPTQLGKHFWPPFSFVSGLRIDYLSPTIYATDILIWLLLICLLFKTLLGRKEKNQKSKIKNQGFIKTNWKVVAFIAFLIMNVFLSKSPLLGLYGLVKMSELMFFGWYIATRKVNYVRLAILLSLGIFFESFLAIAQVVRQGSLGGVFYFFGERLFRSTTPGIANVSLDGILFLRPYGTFPHPNVLAGYLTIVMTMVISNIPAKRDISPRDKFPISNAKKIFYSVAIVLGSIALFLTLSRIAIVLWILIAVMTLFSLIKDKIKKVVVSSILILMAILVFLHSPFASRFLETSFVDESVQLRITVWQSAAAMTKDHPLFGVGVLHFIPTFPFYQHAQSVSLFSQLQPVHNIYLLIAAETGLLGLGFFLWFIWKTIIRIKKQESRSKGIFSMMYDSKFMLLFIVLILGFFDHYFLTLQQGQLLMALVFGFCWSCYNIKSM